MNEDSTNQKIAAILICKEHKSALMTCYSLHVSFPEIETTGSYKTTRDARIAIEISNPELVIITDAHRYRPRDFNFIPIKMHRNYEVIAFMNTGSEKVISELTAKGVECFITISQKINEDDKYYNVFKNVLYNCELRRQAALADKEERNMQDAPVKQHYFKYIYLWIDNTYKRIWLKQIFYIKADGKGVIFYVDTGKGKLEEIKSISGIGSWMVKLEPENFIETHKSYLINGRYFESFDPLNSYITEEDVTGAGGCIVLKIIIAGKEIFKKIPVSKSHHSKIIDLVEK